MVEGEIATVMEQQATHSQLMRVYDDRQSTHPGYPLRLADMNVATFLPVRGGHVHPEKAPEVKITIYTGIYRS